MPDSNEDDDAWSNEGSGDSEWGEDRVMSDSEYDEVTGVSHRHRDSFSSNGDGGSSDSPSDSSSVVSFGSSERERYDTANQMAFQQCVLNLCNGDNR